MFSGKCPMYSSTLAALQHILGLTICIHWSCLTILPASLNVLFGQDFQFLMSSNSFLPERGVVLHFHVPLFKHLRCALCHKSADLTLIEVVWKVWKIIGKKSHRWGLSSNARSIHAHSWAHLVFWPQFVVQGVRKRCFHLLSQI